MRYARSQDLYAEARDLMPGGVNSPVRAFGAVGGTPVFIARGEGPYLWDVDGTRYVDFVGSWGPLILGHAHPAVVEAVCQAARNGTTFGAPTEAESVLASMIVEAFPSVDKVRFVNSGTEATMSALRVARAYTGRPKVVKMQGGYHGHTDALLAQAGSGVATFGLPDSPGVTAGMARDTLVVPYNDLQAVEEAFRAVGDQIAAVIVEPVAGNMGVVVPEEGYLEGLRRITRQYGALLVFDEVITGFRVAYGGAQTLWDIRPDLTCLGKVIGGGLPVGAYGGAEAIMSQVAPAGPVYQAGTLSGNPLAMAAGIATLRELRKPGAFEQLEARGQQWASGLRSLSERWGIALQVNGIGSMLTAFFTDVPVRDYASAKQSDTALYARYFHKMLDRGVYLAPSQFEASFVSLAHSAEVIDEALGAAGEVFQQIAAGQ
ncbi:MAG: glutamate-1-semialdehyde 2,1-aminomutase [Anaerolineae bacterium]